MIKQLLGFLMSSMCVCLYVGCTEGSTSNGLQVPFSKIVGNYVGNSKNCIKTTAVTDTLCSKATQNQMRIVLFDLKTITLTDDLNKFSGTKIPYLSTESLNNETIHSFTSTDSTTTISIKFNETRMEVICGKVYGLGTIQESEIFIGKK